jgi:hypothetical protein
MQKDKELSLLKSLESSYPEGFHLVWSHFGFTDAPMMGGACPTKYTLAHLEGRTRSLQI